MNETIQQAVFLIERGKLDQGRFLLETLSPEFLSEEDRIEWAIWLSRVLLYGERDDVLGALEIIDRTLKQHENEPRLLIAKAIILGEAERLNEAEQFFAKAVLAAPNDWQGHYNRGVFREQVGKFGPALRSYSVAAKRAAGRSALPYKRQAWLLKRLNRFEEAIDAIKKYLEAEPYDSHEWITLATLLSDTGQFTEAEKCFQTALSYEPGNTTAWFNNAVSYQRQGKIEELGHCLAELARWAPGDFRTDWIRAIYYNELGQTQKSAKLFLEVFDRSLSTNFFLGEDTATLAAWMFPQLRQMGAIEEAMALMKQAFQGFYFDSQFLTTFVENFGIPCFPAYHFVLTIDCKEPVKMADELGILREWRYERRYEIIAESESTAWQMAKDAESEIGGQDIHQGSILFKQPFDEPQRQGIIAMSEGRAYPEEN